MATALSVISRHGYWGEECVGPLTTLDAVDVDVTVATPSGDPLELDERSVDPNVVDAELADRVRDVQETDERLSDPAPISQIDADNYDAVVFPDGHGTSTRMSTLADSCSTPSKARTERRSASKSR